MDLLSTAEEGVEWRLGWLGKFQRTSGELLEVGCGRGQLLIEAKKRGWSVRGVEISHAAVRRLRDEFDLEVLHGSLAEAGFPDSSFDVITSSHVLEHLPSPSSALREIHRILKAGGMLQVAVPNIRSFDFAINRQRWRGLHLPYHLYHFSPATLTKLLVKSGFRPIEVWPGITESIQKRIDRLLAIFDRLQAHAKNSRTGFESGEQPLDHSILTLWSSVKLLMKNILVRAFPGENLIAHGVKDR